jgi:NADPH2:quinone reductase
MAMRAAWYERQGAAREVLVVGEMEMPQPGIGEVRVRVYRSGLNPGDIKKRADAFGLGMAYPRVIPHSDGAGVIDAVGAGVAADRVGERVWVYGAQSYRPFGTAAEYVALPDEQAVRLPDAVGFAIGACLGIPARTAHAAVFAAGSVSGRTVLTAGGAGNVGRAAVALAAWGGATVIATVGNPAHTDLVRSAGAAHVLDYHAADVAAQVRALTGGAGVDLIVEVAFGRNLPLDAAVIAQHGVISAYSSDADAEPRLPFWPLLFNNVTIRLVGSDDLSPVEERRAVADITTSLDAGALQPHIARRFPLEEIATAHEAMEGPHPPGHIILDIG